MSQLRACAKPFVPASANAEVEHLRRQLATVQYISVEATKNCPPCIANMRQLEQQEIVRLATALPTASWDNPAVHGSMEAVRRVMATRDMANRRFP